MSVLKGVGGEPTLGQHENNGTYFQTPGSYICVIQKTTFRRCLFCFLKNTIFIINYLGTYSQVA